MLARVRIRDLFWLTLVVAIGLGWLDHQRMVEAQQAKELEAWI